MRRLTCAPVLFVAFATLILADPAWSRCPNGVHAKEAMPLTPPTETANCSTTLKNGFPIPDTRCTPGAINPTVTQQVLQSGKFKTSCTRDKSSTASEKAATYGEYNITHPGHNTGQTQTCELDHLISLELGGADTVDNIWPQCGPDGVTLAKRYFKIKDKVENYLAAQVRAGSMTLEDAQRGIATDWPQYIDASKEYFTHHSISGFGLDQ
jgi:hypothetical protein